MAEIPSVKIKYSPDLEKMLKKMEAENSYVAFELLWLAEPDSKYHNGLKISYVGVSKDDWCFDVLINGKKTIMKVGKFVRYFLGKVITDQEVFNFTKEYNKFKNGEPSGSEEYLPIEIGEFSYNPKDVRSTFLSLVSKTYPHGHEDEVLKFMPELKKDIVGNYYLIVGESETMFTAHLDTADRKQDHTILYDAEQKGESYIITDGHTILGADDKSGVVVMLYMIEHKVPGIYYFFIGEERGGIGSGKLSAVYSEVDYLANVKRCVSFDRRDYHSVITHQLWRRCCSDEFGTALCEEYNKSKSLNLSLDTTGIYTDSASFMDDIPECTNISVGYFHEHTGDEYQNLTFLEKLCTASVNVNWEGLPSVRKVGLNQEILTKYKGFIKDLRAVTYELEVKTVGDEGRVFIRVDLEESDIDLIHKDLSSISLLLSRHKMDPDITFDDTYAKIELR